MELDNKKKFKKLIAIIPARGGSKRLPRKNILPLDNVPLMIRVIRTTKKTEIFDQIIVSSEDTEIQNLAKKENVVIHNRSPYLATDKATVAETCLDVLKKFPAKNFCCIYATAPFIEPIESGIPAIVLTTCAIPLIEMRINTSVIIC